MLCSADGVPLPSIYLLGQQKSGTTTIATAFFQAGVVAMVENRSEGNVPIYIRREIKKSHTNLVEDSRAS